MPLGGRADRSKPCRPRQKRLQAPSADLRTRQPARAGADRRALALTAGNHNDIGQLLPLVDAIPPVRGKRGRPRRRPRRLLGDGAYHSRRHRQELRRRGISAAIPRPRRQHGSGLGRERWVVERTIAWLHQYRRRRVRYERRADIHDAFLQIAGCLICLKLLNAEESFC